MRLIVPALITTSLAACQAAPPDDEGAGSSAQTQEMPTVDPTASGAAPGAPTAPDPSASAGPGTLPPLDGPEEGIIIGDPTEEAAPVPTATVECAGVAEEATEVLLPVDVIIVIDNSSSMSDEIIEVQNRINGDFAEIMGASGLDYRVIMIARYGDVNTAVGQSDHPICVSAPLGGTTCAAAATEPLVNNDPIYFHYSSDVGSREPWCDILTGYSSPDEDGGQMGDRDPEWTPLLPNGFSEVLREDAFKHFLVITDDVSSCPGGGMFGGGAEGAQQGGTPTFNDGDTVEGGLTAAQQFDEALLALSPEQFGTAEERKYRWHSIVGMVEKAAVDGAAPEPWYPDEPVTTELCGEMGDSVGAGTGFQQLSVLTGGLRYPSCLYQNFNAVFNAIAEGIIQGAMLSCEWEIPEVPDGERFDKDLVNVEFTAGDGVTQVVPKAASLEACADAPGWYFDSEEDPTLIKACPASCAQFQTDMAGKVNIVFGCATITKGVF